MKIASPESHLEHLPVLETAHSVPPYAVDLGERAIALANIAEYLNQTARLRGAKKSPEFAGRYGSSALTVLSRMEAKRVSKEDFDASIAVLTAEDALRAQGMDEDQIALAHVSTQAEINKAMGLGVPGAPKIRKEAVERAEHADNKQ